MVRSFESEDTTLKEADRTFNVLDRILKVKDCNKEVDRSFESKDTTLKVEDRTFKVADRILKVKDTN